MSDASDDKRPKTTFESLVNPPGDQGRSGSVPTVAIVVGIVVVIAIVAVMAIVLGGSDDDTADGTGAAAVADPIEIAEVVVDGELLPPLVDPVDDPAVGLPAPELNGLSFAGEPVEIFFDGRPKLIAFLAHWCPVCQEELPEIVDWVDGGGVPDDVDLYFVATAVTDERPNFPPSDWFAREGVTDVPVLVDSAASSAAEAFGLNAFPYWVVLDADGTVVQRISGRVPQVLGLPADDAFDLLAQAALTR